MYAALNPPAPDHLGVQYSVHGCGDLGRWIETCGDGVDEMRGELCKGNDCNQLGRHISIRLASGRLAGLTMEGSRSRIEWKFLE